MSCGFVHVYMSAHMACADRQVSDMLVCQRVAIMDA